MNNIVIIGNGAAGNSAAETIRQHDREIPVIIIAREALPEYSACALPDCLAGWVKRDKLFIKETDDYVRMGIDMRWGQQIGGINPEQRQIITEQGAIAYDQLILATGSRAVIPPVPGADLDGNFVVKTVADIDAIKRHCPRQALVVGSGNIGVEAAEALQNVGCRVTLVELQDRILPRIFDEEPARRIRQVLAENGLEVMTGERVLSVQGTSKVEQVITDKRSVACDTVIWAAGVKQNVEAATAAGISLGSLGGIKVDPGMRTNVNNIYACGDCIESIDMLTGLPTLSLLWPNAKQQGRVAALNCLGRNVSYQGAISLVVEDIYGLTAVSMGLTSEALAGQEFEIMEGSNADQYWRVLVQDNRVMGMQSLGVTSGLGAIMGLIKNRMPLAEIGQVLADPSLLPRAAWYLPGRRFVGI